jgi:hypothetical protein
VKSKDCTQKAGAADNSSILSLVTVEVAGSSLLVPPVVVSRDTDMMLMMSHLPILVQEGKKNSEGW